MLYLKEANMEDAAKEYAFVSELPQCENGFTNEASPRRNSRRACCRA